MSKEDPISSNKNSQVKQENGQITFDWMQFVDSTRTIHIQNDSVDSLVLYFTGRHAPEVYRKNLLILWKDGRELKTDLIGAFDRWLMINKDHYVFFYNRNSLIVEELYMSDDELKTQTTVVIDPKESGLKSESFEFVQQDSLLRIKAKMYNDIFNTYSTDSIVYTLKFDNK